MTKALIRVGFTEYVLDLQEAITVTSLLASAEVHLARYVSKTEERASYTSYHIYHQDDKDTERTTLTIISDNAYRQAKLLGKPDDI
jgi:fibronectin type 3 domain-containing protein